MSRPSLAIAAVLVLAAGASGCAPQCTCPATVPAPAGPLAVPTTPRPAEPVADGPLRILNTEEAQAQMRSVYPTRMAQAGVRGDALVDVTVDETGTVQSAADVRVSNGAFRGPALTVAHALRFSVPPTPGTMVRVRMRWQATSTHIEIVQR